MNSALIPYMRKSSGEEPELSLARQRRAIQAWAELHDVELAPEVWEPHVSGKKSWRERGLGEAIAAVERGEAAGIICEEQSRLSRENMRATAEVWEALEKAKARLVCTAEGIDTATGDHELSFAIRAALAREQWKQYARRMEDVKRRKVESGVMIGPTPFGYVKQADKTLAPDPATAPIVRELYELRASGASWGELASYLDERTGHVWARGAVSKMLRNRVYLGDIVYGDLVKEGAHEALVDAPLFLAATCKQGAHPGRKTDRWLLSGFCTCGSCGQSMLVYQGGSRRRRDPKRGKMEWVDARVHRRYKCRNRACKAKASVEASRLEAWTLETLWRLLGSRVEGDKPSVDLSALVDAVSIAERRLEQSLAPEAQDALGDRWAPTVKERRKSHEDALAALGDARQAVGHATVDFLDLRDKWNDLGAVEQRDALATYALERVIVNGPNPSEWEVVLR